MHKAMKIKSKYAVLLICFALGWIVGLVVKDLNWFQYDSSFNLFELLYCVITALVAFYLTGVIEDSIQKGRAQKDILIGKYNELDAAIKDVLESIMYKNDHYEVSNYIINLKIKTIATLSKQCEDVLKRLYPNLVEDNAFSKISSRTISRYCTKLSNGDEDIKLIKNKWEYSNGRYCEIEKEIWSCREKCLNNILLINQQ